MSNYITMCLNGEIFMDGIDDCIDEWHEIDTKLKLNEFLGITEKEYKYYLADEDMLPYIINAHKFNKDIDEIIDAFKAEEELQFAARSSDMEKAQFLIQNLKKYSN